MRKLALIANLTREGTRAGLELLLAEAARCGLSLLADEATAACHPALIACAPEAFVTQGAEGVISLGGDGSLLAAVHTLAAAGIDLPIIGLNVGNLGYLTAANEDGFAAILDALAQDNFSITARTALSGEHWRGGACIKVLHDALNDIVLSRSEGGHTLTAEVTLDGHPVARYCCDGLLIATPTGSTAYSLSVGGPIVVSGTSALVLSVIAPHALTARPLVMPDTTKICVRLVTQTATAVYSDGQCEMALLPGDEVHITASPRPIRMIVPNTLSPYTSLSHKLGWGSTFTR